MRVTVNGSNLELDARLSVSDLLKRMKVSPDGHAVERNARIVPRSLHQSEMLADGDRLEIVRFVGGG